MQRVLQITITLLVLSFGFVTNVAALESPAESNISPGAPSTEQCLAASGGEDRYCSTGWITNMLKGFGSLFGQAADGTYEKWVNAKAAQAGGDSQAFEKRFKDTQPGLAGIATNINYGLLEQRPASGIVFALDRFDNALTPQPVYAQESPQPYFPGTGYALLEPIQAFWGWSLAVSFSFMILIILIVSFALMFRARLDGQQVVQLQNAIPGIVMAMILIPLSYPISGLFIDAISLGTNVIHGFLFSEGGPGRAVYIDTELADAYDRPAFNAENTRGLYADDIRLNVFNVRELIGVQRLGEIGGNIICPATAGDNGGQCGFENYWLLNFVDQFLSWIRGQGTGQNGGFALVIGELLNLAFSLIAIIVSFRIAWRLIKKLLVLMFMPILSPFIFATVAIPGSGTANLIKYLKDMGAASLHFIAAYGLFLLSIIFTHQAFFRTIPNIQTYRFVPPLLGGANGVGEVVNNVAGDVLEGNTTAMMFTLLGAGIFLAIPKILDTINERLGVEEGLIPKALQPYVDDMKYSGGVTFQKTPAAIAAAAGTAGTVYNSSIGALGKRYGDSKPSRFEDPRSVTYMKQQRAKLSQLLSDRAAAKGPIAKAAYDARIAALRASTNVAAGAMGSSQSLNAPKGEKGADYKASFQFTEVERGITSKSVKIIADRPDSRTLGVLLIEAADDASAPEGQIVFNTYGPAGPHGLPVIGKLSLNGGASTADIILLNATKPDPDGGVAVVDRDKVFAGQSKVALNVAIYIPRNPSTYVPGEWSTDTPPAGKRVQIFVAGNQKDFPFRFGVSL